jgi:hypothetical protein
MTITCLTPRAHLGISATPDTSRAILWVVAGKRREPATQPTIHLNNLGGGIQDLIILIQQRT